MKLAGFPKRVKVGLHLYRLRSVKNITDSSGWLYGRTDRKKTLIEVDPTVSPSQLRDTILHEILHAIIGDQPIALAEDQEELVIRGITPVLLAVLRENPELVAFLLKD